jgi:DNA (cytosine-5)-methyltransferase 1
VAHPPTYLSFFSGCLGLDLGFHAAGFRCLSLNEFNRHAAATIEQNLYRFGSTPPRLYTESMLDLTPERIMHDLDIVPGEVDVMIGGPPCQSFSVAGKRGGLDVEVNETGRRLLRVQTGPETVSKLQASRGI